MVKYELEFDSLLMLGPGLELAHELRLQILEALRLVLQLLAYPLDCTVLIVHKEAELAKLCGSGALAVVLGDLVWQEVHAITLGKSMRQPL